MAGWDTTYLDHIFPGLVSQRRCLAVGDTVLEENR